METIKLLLIETGGTIAGVVANDENKDKVIKTSENFTELLSTTLAAIKTIAKIEVDIKDILLSDYFSDDYANEEEKEKGLDSSNILPKHWSMLAQIIKDEYDNYDSFIITHGTNTLGYSAAALSFALANLSKPVVLTGSQVPAGLPGSDAITNLENSLRVAVMKRREGERIRGVLVVFGSHIITGTRVKKDTEFDYDAFKTFGTSSIGRIGRIIDINETNLIKHVSYLKTKKFPEAVSSKDLICENKFDMRIASITEFPGMDINIFKTLTRENDIRGFILRAFGAGDPSERLVPILEFLKKEKIPIIITTQAPNGNSNFQVNEPGQYIKEHDLAIPAYDMSVESQTTKLAWLLAKMAKGKLTYEQVCEDIITDIRGEINVKWEITMI